MPMHRFILLAGDAAEVAGVGAICAGALVALALVPASVRARGWEAAYVSFRRRLSHAILLGLEFLVAADIIRSVSSRPTLLGVSILGLIVLVRTFLSFTLQLEVEGRWPWQRPR